MKRDCPFCEPSQYRRVNRRGWFEREVLARWFGLFPWECVICRKRRFLRKDGLGPTRMVPNGSR